MDFRGFPQNQGKVNVLGYEDTDSSDLYRIPYVRVGETSFIRPITNSFMGVGLLWKSRQGEGEGCEGRLLHWYNNYLILCTTVNLILYP